MAAVGMGSRVVFFGSHKQPSYVVESYSIPSKQDLCDGDILIKVLLTTLCPIDLDHIDGQKQVRTPCILGHEGVGEVLISYRSGQSAGDRVVFGMVNKCGCCCNCNNNMSTCSSICGSYSNCSLKDCCGSYSTHMVLKRETHAVTVPDNVSSIVAGPANCALATMVNAVTFITSTIKGSVAVIQGANLLGLYGCALLHEAGFHVYCHDVSSAKLKLVPLFGAVPVLIDNESIFEESLHANSADVIVDVCGDWDVIPCGLNLLRPYGAYVFVGLAHDNRSHEINVDVVLKKCITVKGVQGYKSVHLEKAVEFLSRTANRFPYETLVSPPYSLQEFHNAVALAQRESYYRVAITPSSF